MIIGFKKDRYSKVFVNMLKPKAIYQLYLQSKNDDDCIIYNSIEDYFEAANNELVETQNYYWYQAEI